MRARGWRFCALATALPLLVGVQWIYWVEPSVAVAALEYLTPWVVYRVKTGQPLVGLSFDDGPHPTFTPQVLDILHEHGARATFFLIGERALRAPALVARIKKAGHEVGNHYFMGGSTLGHSDAVFLDYLARTDFAIGAREPRLFRPPGGVAWPHQLKLARSKGYTPVLGSAYPHDPAHPPVWYIRWLIAKNLSPGAIVILHDGIRDPSRSIAALPDILDIGRDRGLRFVAVGTLLKAAEQADGS